jgi:predicted phosphodiesterase
MRPRHYGLGVISDTHGLLRPEAVDVLRGSDLIVHAVIAGHSHRPLAETRHGVLFFNPGSAGPRRFKLPISVGHIVIEGSRVTGRLETLEIPT